VPAAAVTGILVVALAGVAGTTAYLNANAVVPGATIKAGTFGLTIDGQVSTSLGTWTPTPAVPHARSFTVKNTGDAAATVTGQVAVTSSQAIRTYTRLRLTPVASSGACTNVVTGGVSGPVQSFPTTTTIMTLTPGQSRTLCAVVSLDQPVPIARSGESVSFTLTLTATQQGA
jgi:predicted ribosomally synthesized peptide with SipW-like signal peptide